MCIRDRIYTEYQQVLLTQLQNNDKRIEEIKKEKEEIQEMFLQESKFKPGDLIQIDYSGAPNERSKKYV